MQSFLMLPLAILIALSPLGACDPKQWPSPREAQPSQVIETMETDRQAKEEQREVAKVAMEVARQELVISSALESMISEAREVGKQVEARPSLSEICNDCCEVAEVVRATRGHHFLFLMANNEMCSGDPELLTGDVASVVEMATGHPGSDASVEHSLPLPSTTRQFEQMLMLDTQCL